MADPKKMSHLKICRDTIIWINSELELTVYVAVGMV